jgi:hypothetical protein
MAEVEPCEKHEIINCSICHHPSNPPRITVGAGGGKFSRPRTISSDHRWIQAKYPGHCYECHSPFEEGDLITRSLDDEGWICEDCA